MPGVRGAALRRRHPRDAALLRRADGVLAEARRADRYVTEAGPRCSADPAKSTVGLIYLAAVRRLARRRARSAYRRLVRPRLAVFVAGAAASSPRSCSGSRSTAGRTSTRRAIRRAWTSSRRVIPAISSCAGSGRRTRAGPRSSSGSGRSRWLSQRWSIATAIEVRRRRGVAAPPVPPPPHQAFDRTRSRRGLGSVRACRALHRARGRGARRQADEPRQGALPEGAQDEARPRRVLHRGGRRYRASAVRASDPASTLPGRRRRAR